MRIAVLAGDGIGPEVTAQAVKALRAIAANNGPQFEMAEAPIGDAAYDRHGDPLPPATAELAAKADAILFGAAGTYESDLRPPKHVAAMACCGFASSSISSPTSARSSPSPSSSALPP
ncbi:isocitrate/isopropylmalate family dehydrogenase [Dankookia sp. P2]|uniref:isocitrate/isopropylmalate family dehydrogenase n=1 Tax=Dankookia sp. P2 TaxID=3423955 RepID=UPI003D67422B